MKFRAFLGGSLLLGLLVGCGGLEVEPSANGQAGAGDDTPASSPGSPAATGSDCPTPVATLDPSCPCSRRACSPPSMSCPRGTGKSTTTRLGPSGGTASLNPSSGVPFKVDVFSGSLSKAVDIKLSELAVPTPDGYEDWSPIFTIEPLDLDLVNGAALEIPYQVPHSGGGTIPKALTTFVATTLEGPWQPLRDNYINAGFCQATVTTGGYFFVGLPAPDDACH